MKYQILTAALLAAFSASVMANEKAIQSGSELAQVKGCIGCHGMDGIGIGPTFPNLAGQHSSYLVEQLRHYRSGYRPNAIMAGQATNLTDAEIFDLASYYASKPAP
ncbi:c-type cytochrome [Litorivicinus lipolyticus]|uniref:C-type cytochrome n=1 Tax=Litorivicinus lipolyticus TaxID=418701 RepID=A0A5Q2QFS2_9GAMM|nr:cytochrome c [Litorivicinus lipolyticus]QGG81202.1 c-type cytochrome [Litorivicinus lipolyticus]